jgi:hypothetical protein
MATYPIFPSLSRQPSMDTSKSTEDDTIKDQSESGYVSTRPRFTRVRDTWKVNVRNLVAEDKRVLDYFQKVTAARGANSFLFPNLLPNWSFEFAALDATQLVQNWYLANDPEAALPVSIVTSNIEDGAQALSFGTAAATLAEGASITAEVDSDVTTPCTPGDVYLFHARVRPTQGTLADASTLWAEAAMYTYDASGTQSALAGSGSDVNTSTSGWQDYYATFTIPTGAASFRMRLIGNLAGSSSAAITLDGSASILIDAVGCALLTPAQLYGRMAGSDALPRPVRFSKLPEFSDIGFGNGVKRYGVNFELTEV